MPRESHLTEKERQWYLEHKGLRCPKCHSDSIEGVETEYSSGEAYQEVKCIDCGYRWQDIYKLVDMLGEGEF